jgi:hypothetical protein
VQVCKDFFPNLYVGFKDPRVRLHVGDGMFKSRYLLVYCSMIVMGYRIYRCCCYRASQTLQHFSSLDFVKLIVDLIFFLQLSIS